MNDRADKYRMGSSDAAFQLDLIAKVDGVSSAEQYFLNLPDALKDKRVYGALLNVYAQARMREKGESLMNKMRNRGYASHTLPCNVMMTLYLNLGDHEKVESLVLEMKDNNIDLDTYSYNIWFSSCGSQGSAEKMEQVFEKMRLDTTTNTNWTTFSTMATVYIKLEQLEKAKHCLRMLETRITGRERRPYHYLISLYASAGSKVDVYRVWNIYKNATSAMGSKSWKPKPTNISSILNISEQEADTASKDALLKILGEAGCLDDECYMSCIPICISGDLRNRNITQGT